MRRGFVLAAVALGLALAAAAATTAAAAGRGGSATFADPAGDSGSAPDVTGVAVADDGTTGAISIAVTASGTAATPAAPLRDVTVWLDTDGDASTGYHGYDFTLQYIVSPEDEEGWHWLAARLSGGAGAAFTYVPPSATVRFERNGDVLTWTVGRTDLGGAGSFSFDVSTGAEDASMHRVGCDSAPDGGTWRYVLAAPTRTSTVVYRPTIAAPATMPARPAAGRRVTVAFAATAEGEPLAAAALACDAWIAGAPVAHTASLRAGVARVSLLVPKDAAGKQLRVRVTIRPPTYEEQGEYSEGEAKGLTILRHVGAAATKTAAFRIR